MTVYDGLTRAKGWVLNLLLNICRFWGHTLKAIDNPEQILANICRVSVTVALWNPPRLLSLFLIYPTTFGVPAFWIESSSSFRLAYTTDVFRSTEMLHEYSLHLLLLFFFFFSIVRTLSHAVTAAENCSTPLSLFCTSVLREYSLHLWIFTTTRKQRWRKNPQNHVILFCPWPKQEIYGALLVMKAPLGSAFRL